MREIKFRGISQYTGEMVYGQLLRGDNNFSIVVDFRTVSTIQLEPIIKGTQSQYTGLKDVNSQEIYEGDIVEFEHDTRYNGGGYNRSLYKAAIQNGLEFEFLKTGYYIRFNDFKSNLITKELDWIEIKRVQVIGNVYENPELIAK